MTVSADASESASQTVLSTKKQDRCPPVIVDSDLVMKPGEKF
jgi:hypothetical protein